MLRQVLIFIAGLLSSSSSVLHAEDWPVFRGPTGQGLVLSGKLPTTWNQDTNIAWKQKIPGKGWSSPVVARGRVYLTSAVPGDEGEQSLRALCVDAAKGNILWNKEVFQHDSANSPNIHSKNSH